MNLIRFSDRKVGIDTAPMQLTLIYTSEPDRICRVDLSSVVTDLARYLHLENNKTIAIEIWNCSYQIEHFFNFDVSMCGSRIRELDLLFRSNIYKF